MLPLPRRFVVVVLAFVLLAGCGRAAPADLAPLRSNLTQLIEQFRVADKYILTPGSDWSGVTLALLVDTQTMAQELAKQAPAQKEIYLKLADACELFADGILENNVTKMEAGTILFREATTEFYEQTGETLFEPTATPTTRPTPKPTNTAGPSPTPEPPQVMVNATLRIAPDRYAAVIGTVAAGDYLDLVMVSADGMWYQTASGGWINMGNVTSVPDGLPVFVPPPPTQTPTPGPPQATVDTQALANPSVGAAMVARVAAGELLDLVLVTADGRWYQTAAGGWVHAATIANAPKGLPVFGLVRSTATPTAIPTPTLTPAPTQATGRNVATARSGARLRVAPYQDAEVVGNVERGQAVELAGVSEDGMWVITADGLWLLSQVMRDIPTHLPEIDISIISQP